MIVHKLLKCEAADEKKKVKLWSCKPFSWRTRVNHMLLALVMIIVTALGLRIFDRRACLPESKNASSVVSVIKFQ
jgi:hypothetical protein